MRPTPRRLVREAHSTAAGEQERESGASEPHPTRKKILEGIGRSRTLRPYGLRGRTDP